MNYIDRNGNKVMEKTGQDQLLIWLYTHKLGRLLLKPLVSASFSRCMGKLLQTKGSALFVKSFIRRANIDMSEYNSVRFTSFNDFFTRKIKHGCRPIVCSKETLICPCDGRLSVYKISPQSVISIKYTDYTLANLLHNSRLAREYNNGYAIVIRLTVSDYHRYIYAATGQKTKNYHLIGKYHTVNPIANDHVPVYKENTREYTVIKTTSFGVVVQMEVGALMVGKITNHHEQASVNQGDEKGYFEFGGSTVVLLVQEGRLDVREDLLENTLKGFETKVNQGDLLST
jgi:phosphatidylserine decarboxylase